MIVVSVDVILYVADRATDVTVGVASVVIHVADDLADLATFVTICISAVVIHVVSNLADLAAQVTGCVACVVVCVRAGDGKCLKDLLVDVVVTCHAGAREGGVGNVSHQEFHSIGGHHAGIYVSIVCGFRIVDVNVGDVVEQKGIYEGVRGGRINDVIVCVAKLNGDGTDGEGEVVECIVVTKEDQLCVGIDLLDGQNSLAVEFVEAYEAVYVRFSREYHCVNNGDHNRVGCVLAEVVAKHIGIEEVEDHSKLGAECISVLKDQLEHVNGVGEVFGNAGCKELCSDLGTRLVNVGNVVLADQSRPIHSHSGLAVEGGGGDQIVDGGVCHTGKSRDELRSVFFLNIRISLSEVVDSVDCVLGDGSSEVAAKVISDVTKELIHGKAGDRAFVIAEGDEVSLHDLSKINVVPTHHSKLVIGKAKLVCKELCVVSVVCTNGNVVRILNDEVLTGQCIVKEGVDRVVDRADHEQDLVLDSGVQLCKSGLNGSLDCVSCIGNDLVAKRLEVINASVHAVGDQDLSSGVELVKKSSHVDGVNQSVCKLVDGILKEGKKLVGGKTACHESDDVVYDTRDLVNLCDQLFHSGNQLLDLGLNLSDLSLDLCDSGLKLCDSSLKLCLKSGIALCDGVSKLSLKGIELCGELVQLSNKSCLYLSFKELDVVQRIVLDTLKGGDDALKHVGIEELVPSLVSEIVAELRDQLEEVVQRGQQSLGIEDVDVHAKGVKVNLNHSPCSVTVGFNPVDKDGKDAVCIFKDVSHDVVAVVDADECEDGQNDLMVVKDEIEHFIGVVSKELDHKIGVLVQPVVKPSVQVGSDLTGCCADHLNKLCVLCGKIFLEELVGVGNQGQHCIGRLVNCLDNGVVDTDDDVSKCCSGIAEVRVSLFDSSLEIRVDLCDLSLGSSLGIRNSLGKVCLKACDSCCKVSLKIGNCSLEISLYLCDSSGKVSLNSRDLGKDSIFCVANGVLKLLVQLGDLCVSGGLQCLDLSLGLGDESCNLLLDLSGESCNLLLGLGLQSLDCLCGSGLNGLDLSHCLGSKICDNGLQVVVGVKYDDVKELGGTLCTACKLVKQGENLSVGFCAKGVCVVDQCTKSLDGGVELVNRELQRKLKLIADVVTVGEQPSGGLVDLGLCQIKVSVDSINKSGFNRLFICHCIGIVVILAEKRNDNLKLCGNIVAKHLKDSVEVFCKCVVCNYGKLLCGIFSGDTRVHLSRNVLVARFACVDCSAVRLEAGVEVVVEAKNLTGVVCFQVGFGFADVDVSCVCVLYSVNERLDVSDLKKGADCAADGNDNVLAVGINGHAPLVNGIEYAKHQDVCVGIDLVDALKHLQVVAAVACIAVYKTFQQSVNVIAGIFKAFDAFGDIGLQHLVADNGNQGIQSGLKLSCGFTGHINADLFPIKLVGVACQHAVYIVACKSKEVAAADGNRDKIRLFNVFDEDLLEVLKGHRLLGAGILGHIVCACDYFVEVTVKLNVATEEQQEVFGTQRAKAQVFKLIFPVVAKKLLSQKNVSGSLNVLVPAVLLVVLVTGGAVAGKSTVTQGKIEINLAKIQLLIGVLCCNVLKRADQLVRRLCKQLLFFGRCSGVKLLVENIDVIAKRCELGGINELSDLDEGCVKLGIIFLGVVHEPVPGVVYVVIEILFCADASCQGLEHCILDLLVTLYTGVSVEGVTKLVTNCKHKDRGQCSIVFEHACIQLVVGNFGSGSVRNTVLVKLVIELCHGTVDKVVHDHAHHGARGGVEAGQAVSTDLDVVDLGTVLNNGSDNVVCVVKSAMVGVVNAFQTGLEDCLGGGNDDGDGLVQLSKTCGDLRITIGSACKTVRNIGILHSKSGNRFIQVGLERFHIIIIVCIELGSKVSTGELCVCIARQHLVIALDAISGVGTLHALNSGVDSGKDLSKTVHDADSHSFGGGSLTAQSVQKILEYIVICIEIRLFCNQFSVDVFKMAEILEMLCESLAVFFNVLVASGGVLKIKSTKIQGKELCGASCQSKFIDVVFVILKYRQAILRAHISQAREQTAKGLTNQQILNDTSYVQIVIVHIEVILHIVAEISGVAAPSDDLVKEGIHVACVGKHVLLSIGRKAASILVNSGDQLAVKLAKLKLAAHEVNNKVVGKVLDVDNHNLYVGVELIDLLHGLVEVIACTHCGVSQNVSHQLKLACKAFLACAKILAEIVQSYGFELAVSSAVVIGKLAHIGSLPTHAVGKNGLDVVECVNTKVIPTHINGDEVGFLYVVLVSLAKCAQATGKSDIKPALAAGETPFGISVAEIIVIKQHAHFLHTHRGNGKLVEINVHLQRRFQCVCDQRGICVVGSHLVSVYVHARLGCIQGVFTDLRRQITKMAIAVGVGCTQRHVVEGGLRLVVMVMPHGIHKRNAHTKKHGKREDHGKSF